MNLLTTLGIDSFYFHTPQITLGGNTYYSIRLFSLKNDNDNVYYQYLNGGCINKININCIYIKEINNIKNEIFHSNMLLYNNLHNINNKLFNTNNELCNANNELFNANNELFNVNNGVM